LLLWAHTIFIAASTRPVMQQQSLSRTPCNVAPRKSVNQPKPNASREGAIVIWQNSLVIGPSVTSRDWQKPRKTEYVQKGICVSKSLLRQSTDAALIRRTFKNDVPSKVWVRKGERTVTTLQTQFHSRKPTQRQQASVNHDEHLYFLVEQMGSTSCLLK